MKYLVSKFKKITIGCLTLILFASLSINTGEAINLQHSAIAPLGGAGSIVTTDIVLAITTDTEEAYIMEVHVKSLKNKSYVTFAGCDAKYGCEYNLESLPKGPYRVTVYLSDNSSMTKVIVMK